MRALTTSVLVARASVPFGARKVRTQSGVRRVVVGNSGVVPLQVSSVVIDGRNTRSFLRHRGAGPMCVRGTAVRPGRSCSIYISFRPRSSGSKTARIVIRSNAMTNPRVVQLTGRGR